MQKTVNRIIRITGLVSLISIISLFSSCDQSTYGIQAVIGGQLWESNQFSTAFILNDGSLLINGRHRQFPPLVIGIPDFQGEGVTSLDSLNTLMYGEQTGSAYLTTNFRPGELNINRFQPPSGSRRGHIRGTFTATVFNASGDSLRVTEGKLDLDILP
jgi:hypothetical protein